MSETPTCYEAWIADYPKCGNYERNGYTCKGGWCVTDRCKGDCTACSTERVGYVPNFNVCRCEASGLQIASPALIFSIFGVLSLFLVFSWFPIVSSWALFFAANFFPNPYIVPCQILIMSFILYRLVSQPSLISCTISIAVAYGLHSYYKVGGKLEGYDEMLSFAKDKAEIMALSAIEHAGNLEDLVKVVSDRLRR